MPLSTKEIAALIFILGLAATLSFFKLGNPALTDYDEATYATVVEKTLESGDILTLKHPLSGNWFEKPPLYFWISMAASSLVESKELAYRFFSALSGVLAVVLTVLIGRALGGNLLTSALSGLALATTAIFVEAGRQMRLDVPVTLTILLAFYSFIRGLKNPWWLTLIFPSMAFGFLIKSAVTLLAIPVILIFAAFSKNWSWLKEPRLWVGGVVAFLILAPWHIYETLLFGKEFWNEYLIYHVFARFSENVVGGGGLTTEYLKLLLLYATPWIFAIPAGLLALWKFRKEGTSHPGKLSGIFATIALFILLVFEVAQTKIFYYLLPLYPFAALSAGFLVAHIYERAASSKTRMVLGLAAVALTTLALTNTIYVSFRYEKEFWETSVIAEEEKEVALILKKEPLPSKVYLYDYLYRETIFYYSGGRPLEDIQNDAPLNESFFLVMPKHTFANSSFPEALSSRLEKIYEGKSLVLLKFNI